MWKKIILQLKEWFGADQENKYEKIDELYYLTYQRVKNANTFFQINRAGKLIKELERLTNEEFEGDRWLVQRNKNLKLIWAIKKVQVSKES